MAWCHQVTNYYLGQCWPRSIWIYDFTRLQWGKLTFCQGYIFKKKNRSVGLRCTHNGCNLKWYTQAIATCWKWSRVHLENHTNGSSFELCCFNQASFNFAQIPQVNWPFWGNDTAVSVSITHHEVYWCIYDTNAARINLTQDEAKQIKTVCILYGL